MSELQPRTRRVGRGVIAAAVALGATLTAMNAGAQATDVRTSPAIVRAHVADSSGAPIADAEVTLLRGLNSVVATARTNANGDHEFVVDLDSTDYSIMARKIGFARGDRFFSVRRNAVDVNVTMEQTDNGLPAVTVSAENLRQASYNIDADEISASRAPIRSALDVVERLRPDMITSRSGTWGGGSRFGCEAVAYIWVNDRRYVSAYTSAPLDVAMRAKGKGNRVSRLGAGSMTILSDIASEHIESMKFRDCFDKTERQYGTTSALFIVLKDGVGYRPNHGTFVIGDDAKVAKAR